MKTIGRTKERSVSRLLQIFFAGIMVASLSMGCACTSADTSTDPDDSPAGTSVVDQIAASEQSAIASLVIAGDADELFSSTPYQGTITETVDMSGFSASYDLRDSGVVSSVKDQSPWGTCWSFGAIAASETSLMTDIGLTDPTEELDLSELHLAWFSYTPLPADAGTQAGEGVHTLSTDSAGVLNQGGYPFTATSVFSSGIGPVNEDDVPYKNKEDLLVENSEGTPVFYSPEGDWSVDESLQFAQTFELEESSVLPSPSARDLKGAYLYNAAGTKAIKEELMEGRGVEICFYADTSMPGQEDPSLFINLDTWAHYTYSEEAGSNHAVCVVGWDDDYPASNFLEGHEPPGNGAWIVKNSWGSVDSTFPNYTKDGWGVDGSGYFYLSYYDMSISLPESFTFFTDRYGNEVSDYYLIDQYDFMPANSISSVLSPEHAAMANVFEASEDQYVRSLSCETASPNTTATYQLYLLNEGFTDPEDGALLTTVSESYPYGGYHRVQLDEGFLVEEGQQYSVVITLEIGLHYEIIADRSLNESGKNFINDNYMTDEDEKLTQYAVGIINEGESYLFSSGAWQDWSEVIGAVKAKSAGTPHGALFDYDNFAIKAYSDPVTAVQ